MSSVYSQTPLREEAYRLRMSYEQFLQWADEDVHAEWVEGAADLVLEVVSQDSVRRDRQQKFAEYQLPVEEDAIHSRVILGFWLRVEWLGADTMPAPFTTFAQIVGLPMEVLEALQSRRRVQEDYNVPA